MNKKHSSDKAKVTISLTDDEKRVLLAIATNIYKQEAQSRNWKDVALRFGFPSQAALKKFLLKEFPILHADDSST